jgi:hypothetical protein
MNELSRCPSCDAENGPSAAYCQRCGRQLEVHAGASAEGAGSSSASVNAYMVGAIVVAVVLIVGGTLFFLAGNDESSTATDATSTVATTSSTLPPTTLPPTTLPPTTIAPTTIAPTTLPPTTAAPTTVPPPTTRAPAPVVPTTIAPVPTPAPGTGTVTFDQAESFFRAYISTAISGDYVTAWNQLSEPDQRDYVEGFDQFVGFWQSVSFADVQRVESRGGGAGFQSMRADMAYGQVDGDPTSFEVIDVDVNVRPDGTLQIFDYRFVGTQ